MIRNRQKKIFILTYIFRHESVEVYCLKDYADEQIFGTFYAQ